MDKINQNIEQLDIAIVGAGPAGVAASLELAELGHANEMIVFDRENQVAMTSRHCNHQGFGFMEFRRLLSGEKYANTLAQKARDAGVKICLNYTLVKIDDNILTFSTPKGIQRYQAKRILFALGARENTRASKLIGGGRSPNIITTGTLQRFTYIQKLAPFKRAVIIGSEIVSFSAIMTAKHAGMKIVGVIENKDKIDSFGVIETLSKFILSTPVYTSSQLASINTVGKDVVSVTISTNGESREIECDGVIFSGDFIPESAILQKNFNNFNTHNQSLNITQNFQTDDERFFLAGNVLRGALTAFNCFFEGRNAGKAISASLSESKESAIATISVDENIDCWYHPSLVDTASPSEFLTKFRLKHRAKGVLSLYKNGSLAKKMNIDALPYKSITIKYDGVISRGDSFNISFCPDV